MPGLERETEILEASKRNSSQTTIDSGFPATPLNNEGIATSDVGNINTSTSVVTTQEANKGNSVKNYYFFFILLYYTISVTTADSPVVEADSIINQIKKEQRSLHFARRQATPNRQILKSTTTTRDVTYTQFAVIDDDNISAMQQVTRGGGGIYNFCLTFSLFELNN